MTMTDFAFSDATPVDDMPDDSIPPLADVEYPCDVCGNESGPYGGRGPKPKRCTDHKRKTQKGTRPATRVGATSTLATQALGVLEQGNALMALLAAGAKLFGTSRAIMEANEGFKEKAYPALVADPELCKFLLKAGPVTGKFGLTLAYVGMGMEVAPIAMMEIQERRAARLAETDDPYRT